MGTDPGQALRQHGLELHRVMSDNGVYRRSVSDESFLAYVDATLGEAAGSVGDSKESHELALLSLPIALLHDLHEVVHMMTWDYEFGLDSLFESLAGLFDGSPLAGQRFSLHALDSVEVAPGDYTKIVSNLERVLAPDFKLYEPATGDQSGMMLLIPSRAEAPLRELLIAADDPRAEALY
jgi:hypothetical protein